MGGALRRSQREFAFWRIQIVSGLLDVTVVTPLLQPRPLQPTS
jgi:hypothetical protein